MSRSLTVVQLLPALDAGGVERAALEIAEALVRAGHRAIVVSAGGRLAAHLTKLGAQHIALDIGAKSPLSLRHVFALRSLFRQVDIVHARSRLPAWLAWLAWMSMRGARPRFITTVHGLNSVNAYSGIMIKGERVIAVSKTVRDHIVRHYPQLSIERVRVIPRSLDPMKFPSGYRAPGEWRRMFEAEYPQSAGRRWICLPGRGTRLKGHEGALRLLSALCAGDENVALILLGTQQSDRGQYVQELLRMSHQLGIADRVVITPPRSDVCDVMSESAFVLQLSRKPEAFGRTVVEALHLGVPVIGWAHGGVGELLQELFPQGAVPLGDEKVLLKVARQFLAQPTKPPPFQHYRLEQMQAATLAVYQELADEVGR